MNRRFRKANRRMNDEVITTGRPPKAAKVNYYLDRHFDRLRAALPPPADSRPNG